MIPTYAQVVDPQPEPRPNDLATPEPQYVEARPVPVMDKPDPMATPEKQRLRRAAFRATKVYPGPVGELISRELMTFEEMSWALGQSSLVTRLADHVLELAGPDHGDGSYVRPFSRR